MAGKRRLNYELIQVAHANGYTQAEISRKLGIHNTTVRLAIDPAFRERKRLVSRRYHDQDQTPCVDCGEPCYSQRCPGCAAKQRIISVRPDELQCGTCHQWKPDTEFSVTRARNRHRRHRRDRCKACANAAYSNYYRSRKHKETT